MALEATQGMGWLKQRFKKFILDNVSPDDVSSDDKLFPFWSFSHPSRENGSVAELVEK